MTYTAILIASLLLLTAFAVERLSRRSGIPPVIAMIALGVAGKPLLSSAGVAVESLDVVVPIIGTIGLVLIVLEGALDIQLRRDRLKAAAGAFGMAGAGFALCLAVLIPSATLMLPLTAFQAALLVVPFAVISSAVAIPSSHVLPPQGREHVVYESSLSDILGVLVFFALIHSDGSLKGVLLALAGGSALSLLLGLVCAVGLVLVLMRIDGHIRFIPLLAGLFGLYAAGKLLHLSPLILVLLFGLALNNPTLITRFRPFRRWMNDSYGATLGEFKVLVLELTFAVRGFFFILLGYWTDLSDLASPQAWLAAALVLLVVYGSRHFILRASRHSLAGPLTWIAPRGLITVLLFLTARQALPLPKFLDGTVMLVILISATLVTVARWRGSGTKPAGTGARMGARRPWPIPGGLKEVAYNWTLAMLQRLPDRRQQTATWVFAGITLTLLGFIRTSIEAEYAFASLAIIPVLLVTWAGGFLQGVIASMLAVEMWLLAGLLPQEELNAAWIPLANGVTRLATYVLVAYLTAQVRTLLARETELATRDALTGLLNRRAFFQAGEQEIERSRRHGHRLAIVFLDLDNFKRLNDTRGHSDGDRALKAVAKALTATLRTGDRVARLGGDEFAILIPETDDVEASDAGQRIADAVAAALTDFHPVSASIGVVGFRDATEDFHAMLNAADALMYEIKQQGKSAFRFRSGSPPPRNPAPPVPDHLASRTLFNAACRDHRAGH